MPRNDKPALEKGFVPALDDKVAFLSQPAAYGMFAGKVVRRETHMSWVFFADDCVFKLKKPVQFAYLNFSTLALRESACRAELKLNRRLARDVYLSAAPLVWTAQGFAIGASGKTVDWLVVMRRLDEERTLEHLLPGRGIGLRDIEHLITTLSAFYRYAARVHITPRSHLAEWHRSLRDNRAMFLHAGLAPEMTGIVRRIDKAQRGFLRLKADLLAARVRARKIVDGHGDLRPEHIFIDDTIRIIDCLEFNARLRAVDPLDELAFLCVECDRLGASWASDYLHRRFRQTSKGDRGFEALFRFYRCYRATLRARLALAHLCEPSPRTPEKWPRLARIYLRLAEKDAAILERMLSKP